MAAAGADAVIWDRARALAPGEFAQLGGEPVFCSPVLAPQRVSRGAQSQTATDWILLTSGTTGAPKLVLHTLASLVAAIRRAANVGARGETVWSTFYDIRRFGGLQIFLRALVGGGSMVLSSADETTRDFLTRVKDSCECRSLNEMNR